MRKRTNMSKNEKKKKKRVQIKEQTDTKRKEGINYEAISSLMVLIRLTTKSSEYKGSLVRLRGRAREGRVEW